MTTEPPDWPWSQPPWVNREGAFPAPTAAELVAFERRHSIELPPRYRDLLLTFTGGPPEGCDFWIPALEEHRPLRELYPLTSASDGADLEGCIDWVEFIPRELVAFADDGYGSWFCLGVRGPTPGEVFYVSHTLQEGDPRRIARVAASFDGFMHSGRPPAG